MFQVAAPNVGHHVKSNNNDKLMLLRSTEAKTKSDRKSSVRSHILRPEKGRTPSGLDAHELPISERLLVVVL